PLRREGMSLTVHGPHVTSLEPDRTHVSPHVQLRESARETPVDPHWVDDMDTSREQAIASLSDESHAYPHQGGVFTEIGVGDLARKLMVPAFLSLIQRGE